MEKAFKFRIYPNEEQEILIQKTFGCVRFVYNYFLNRREEAYDNNEKGLTPNKLNKELTQLKKQYTWLKEPDSASLEMSLRRLNESYAKFFKKQAIGPKFTEKKLKRLERLGRKPNRFDLNGHPKFKSKKTSRKAYTTTCSWNNIKFLKDQERIQLPKLGKVKFRKNDLDVQGRILGAIVSQEPSGKYYVSIYCTEIEQAFWEKTGKQVGIDLGLKHFAITSEGTKKENPRFLRKNLEKLKFLQRSLSRKSIGSNRYKKNKLRYAKLNEHIVNMRNDFLQKYSTQLVKDYDIICVETLKVKNMMQNHKLALSISDVSWSKFIGMLEYKTQWYGKTLIKIDTFFPSTKICHNCNFKNEEIKSLNIRHWQCPNCGEFHDRDINAAINILNEGLKYLK